MLLLMLDTVDYPVAFFGLISAGHQPMTESATMRFMLSPLAWRAS